MDEKILYLKTTLYALETDNITYKVVVANVMSLFSFLLAPVSPDFSMLPHVFSVRCEMGPVLMSESEKKHTMSISVVRLYCGAYCKHWLVNMDNNQVHKLTIKEW